MFECSISELHNREVALWQKREELLQKLSENQSLQDDLKMENYVLSSDMVLEVGLTKEDFDYKLQEIYNRAQELEDEKYKLYDQSVKINIELKSILDTLSKRITETLS